MTKKGVRVVVIGAQRPRVDVDAMTQIVIALGRELAERARARKKDKNVATPAEAEP